MYCFRTWKRVHYTSDTTSSKTASNQCSHISPASRLQHTECKYKPQPYYIIIQLDLARSLKIEHSRSKSYGFGLFLAQLILAHHFGMNNILSSTNWTVVYTTTAIGSNTTTTGSNTITTGSNATTTGSNAAATGSNTTVTGKAFTSLLLCWKLEQLQFSDAFQH